MLSGNPGFFESSASVTGMRKIIIARSALMDNAPNDNFPEPLTLVATATRLDKKNGFGLIWILILSSNYSLSNQWDRAFSTTCSNLTHQYI